MSITADLKAFLAGRAAISAVAGSRVSINRVPMGYDGPYVWLARRNIDRTEDSLDEAAGTHPFRVSFDVECIAMDGEDVDSLAAAVEEISNYRGAFGNGSSVQAIFITGQSDEYVPRGKAADEDFELASFSLEICGYVPGS